MTDSYKIKTLKSKRKYLMRSMESLETSTFFEQDEKNILLAIYTARLESYNCKIAKEINVIDPQIL
jgi:hypothetical protein